MRKTRDLALALAAACALAARPTRALAAPPPDAPTTAEPPIDRDAVFHRGSALFAQERYADAIAVWEPLLASIGEKQGWKLLYNLGLAYQRAGDATHAIERLEGFVRRVGEQPGAITQDLDERRRDAVARVRALKASYGALTVIAPPGDAVALVRVGASAPRPAGFTVYLAPGEHDLEVWSGTARARRVTVKLDAGATREIEVDPTAPLEAPRADVADPAVGPRASGGGTAGGPGAEDARATRRAFPVAWAIAGGALTLAAGAAPLAFGLRASAKRSDAASLGPGDTRYASAVSEFEGARTAYDVSYAIPAAVGLAAAALVILKWSTSRGDDHAALAPCSEGSGCASVRF